MSVRLILAALCVIGGVGVCVGVQPLVFDVAEDATTSFQTDSGQRIEKNGTGTLTVTNSVLNGPVDLAVNAGELVLAGRRIYTDAVVTTNKTLVWCHVNLADVRGVQADYSGDNWTSTSWVKQAVTNSRLLAPFRWSPAADGQSATVQFQASSYGKYTSSEATSFQTFACCVTLTQEGDEVYAQITRMASTTRTATYRQGQDGSSRTEFPNDLTEYYIRRLRPVCTWEPTTLTKDFTTVWKDTRLSDVTGVRGAITGSSSWGVNDVNGYLWAYNPDTDTATVQLHQSVGSRLVKLEFRQVGADVQAKITRAAYFKGQTVPAITADWSAANTDYAIATTPNGGAIGVSNLMPLPMSAAEAAKTGETQTRVVPVSVATDATVTTEPTLVWKGVTLAEVKTMTADPDGAGWTANSAIQNSYAGVRRIAPYNFVLADDGASATVQFQATTWTSGKFQTFACCVGLTQNGPDVYAQVTRNCCTASASTYYQGMDATNPSYFPTMLNNCFLKNLRPVKTYLPVTLTANYQTIWKNTLLASVSNVSGFFTGMSAYGNSYIPTGYHFRPCTDPNGDADMEVQYKIDVNRYAYIWLRQKDADVEAKIRYSVYADPSKFTTARTMETDLVTAGEPLGNKMTIPTAPNNGSYGVTALRPLPQSENELNVQGGAIAIASGATLRVAEDVELPIYGALEGNGTLAGARVVFAGEDSTWKLEANETGLTSHVDVSGVTNTDLLQGLKKIEVRYTGTSRCTTPMVLMPNCPLTAEQVSVLVLKVTNADHTPNDDYMLWLDETGALAIVLFDPNLPVRAIWTGAGNRTNLADPNNWTCYNAQGGIVRSAPTADTAVTIPASSNFSWPAGQPFVVRSISFPSEVALSMSCDWRGMTNLSALPDGVTVNLRGQTLEVAFTESLAKRVSFVDSVGGGKLVVSSDAAVSFDGLLTVADGITLAKRGSGTVTLKNLTLVGGTDLEVEQGALTVDSGVEFQPFYTDGVVTTAKTLIWKNTSLALVRAVTAEPAGTGWTSSDWVSLSVSGLRTIAPYNWVKSADGRTVDVQFQAASYGVYPNEKSNTFQTHACCVRLTQEGDDVYAQVTRMAASSRTGYVMGRDAMDSSFFPTTLSNYYVYRLRPIYTYEPVTLSSIYQTIWKDTQLSAVTNVAGFYTGASAWGNNRIACGQYFRPCTDPAGDADMEVQFKIDSNRYTYIQLRQNGPDVEAKIAASVYWNPSVFPGTHAPDADLVKDGVPVGVLQSIPSLACEAGYGTCCLRPLPQSDLDHGFAVAGDVTIAEGATLNVPTGGVLGIGGSLTGKGTLAGDGEVYFAGMESCWCMTADERGLTEQVRLNGIGSAAFLGDLGTIQLTFAGASGYFGLVTLLAETDLSADQVEGIGLEVLDSTGTRIRGSHLRLQDGALVATIGDPNVPVTATWTGAAGNGRLSDAGNWNCLNRVGTVLTNAVPTAETTVIFPAQGAFDWPAGTRFPYCEVQFPSRFALTGACDWRGMPDLALLPSGAEIDLRGTNLTIAVTRDMANRVTFTDSTVKGGELHVEVPSGISATIGSVDGVGPTFTGSLVFVKEGAGTLVNRVKAHSYTGKAVIAEGQMWAFNNANNSAAYSGLNYAIFGKNWKTNPVIVEKGATFDMRGVASMNAYSFQLNGGRLMNSGYTQDWQDGWGALGNVTLTDDSNLVVDENMSWVSGLLDLGGKTLTVQIKSAKIVHVDNLTVTNGLFKVISGGWFRTLARPSCFVDSTFDVGCAVNVGAKLTVDRLVGSYAYTSAMGTNTLAVINTYKPVTDYVASFELQDGATYDLSAATNSWPLTSTWTKQTLAFASGARIKVDIGDREVKSEERLVAWTKTPENVKFVPASNMYALIVKNDGLYLTRGMMVILR